MTIANGKCLDCGREFDRDLNRPVMDGDNRQTAWVVGSICAAVLGVVLAFAYHDVAKSRQKREEYVACVSKAAKPEECAQESAEARSCPNAENRKEYACCLDVKEAEKLGCSIR